MQIRIDNLGKVAVTVEKDYWDITKDYNKLTIVEAPGNEYKTYISRKPVPAGTVLTNREYWIPFSSLREEIVIDFNAFVDSLNQAMQETKDYADGTIEQGVEDITAIKEEAMSIITYIAENGIDSSVLAPNSVTSDKIAPGNVLSRHIGEGEVKSANIGNGEVKSINIGEGEVKSIDIGNGEVKSGNIGDGEVKEQHIAPGAVTTAKLADGMIEQLQTITDAEPTAGSVKPVQSGGVKTAIDNVAFSTEEKVNETGIDAVPTAGSENLVESGGVFPISVKINNLAEKITEVTVAKNVYSYRRDGIVSGLVFTNGIIGTSSDGFCTGLIPVKPNTYYYLSGRVSNVSKQARILKVDKTTYTKLLAVNGASYATNYAFPNIDATGSEVNGPFLTPADAAYVQLNLTPINVTEIGDKYKIMLEEIGSVYDPNFEPSAYDDGEPSYLIKNDVIVKATELTPDSTYPVPASLLYLISQDVATIEQAVSSKLDKTLTESSVEQVTETEILTKTFLSVGGAPATASGFKTYKYSVTPGDTVYITGSFGSGLSSYLYSWILNDSTYQAGLKNTDSTKNTAISDYEQLVPENAIGIYIQTSTSVLAAPSLSKLVVNTINAETEIRKIEQIISDIDDINTDIIDLSEEVENQEHSINILCLGNSFTQDTIGYVPWLLKEAEPNLKLNLYFTYMGGSHIAQYLAYVSNNVSIEGNRKFENHGGWDRIYSREDAESPWVEPESGTTNYHKSYTLYKYDDGANAWVSQSEPTFEEVLGMKNWDLITIQQSGECNYKSWDTYFKPFVYPIYAFLQKKLDYNFKIGYILTHSAYSTSASTLRTRYDANGSSQDDSIVSNSKKIEENTPTEIILPYGTALQNARTTYLDRFGAGDHLLADTAHVNDGIGCLTCAYANVLAILKLIGSKKSIIGSQIVPDAAWLSAHNVPAVSTSVLGLSTYNIQIAQQCAIMAIKYPLQLTDMVANGMVGQYEIEIVDDAVDSSNPILSANSGDSWETVISPKDDSTISSVQVLIGETDVTSSVYNSNTHTISIASVVAKITITVTLS